jgi:DNA-binding transcriptional LysR family regulator
MRTFQDFAAQYPGMEIDVQVGIPGTLLASMKQGHLELVIGSLCETSDTGLLLWQEPLVWAWSAQPVTELPTPLPLALFPEPCPYREVALTQLARAGIAQRTAMLCSSTAGLRAAALAGFAVAPMPVSQLGQGLAVLGAEQGLPDLPDAQYRLFSAPEADQAIVAAVTQLIVEYCSTRRT